MIATQKVVLKCFFFNYSQTLHVEVSILNNDFFSDLKIFTAYLDFQIFSLIKSQKLACQNIAMVLKYELFCEFKTKRAEFLDGTARSLSE